MGKDAFPENSLAFGRERLGVRVPAGWSVRAVTKPVAAALADPEGELERLVRGGAHDLAGMARTARSACVVICDVTRPVPNGVLLPPLVRALLAGGIPPERIVVLVATGLHRPNEGEELRAVVGSDWILETVRVENHYAMRREDHVFLAPTNRGTPLGIDRRFVEADLRIVVGLVEPHFMAGYSGGRKLIAPGIACEETIRTFHNTSFMEHPLAATCTLRGNPLHEEQLDIVKRLGPVWAVNTLLDEERNIVFLNFGEIVASHAEAVAAARNLAEVPIGRRCPVVVSGAAGHPLDATYYQVVKAIVTAAPAVAPGGTLLVAAACREGMGSPEFLEALKEMKERGVEGFLSAARTRPLARIDEWQVVKLAAVLRQTRAELFAPGLDLADRALTGIPSHTSWEAAVRSVLGRYAPQDILLIPDGPYTVPVVMDPEVGDSPRSAAA